MKTRVHYLASTHWDREWYLPFQGFRYRLVKLAGKLLKTLKEEPGFKQFVFDGQTAVLDDILEIQPELRGSFERHIKSGRIHVGPWYTMPDERIVSGEAIIRNLLLGTKTAKSFGAEPMKYGYICDIFGHIAQMPQLFAGSGIPHALLGRGANNHTHPPFFKWKSPDGSAVTVFKLPDADGYGTGRFLHDKAEAPNPGSEEWTEGVAKTARDLYEAESKRGSREVQLWLDGLDHYFPSANIPQALKVAAKELKDEAEIVFSSFPEFAEDIDRLVKRMPVSEGELVKTTKLPGGYSFLISHCLSSHYPMKRLNDLAQNALERWVEPYFALAQLEGRAPAKGFLDLAWKYVIQNHAHDSICGCSVDQVHKDTEYRYDQTLAIAGNTLDEILPGALKTAKSEDPKSVSFALFSSLPFKRSKVVEAEFAWPEANSRFILQGFPDDRVPSFVIEDENGKAVQHQLLSYKGWKPFRDLSQPNPQPAQVVKVLVDARFDGLGPKAFSVKESPKPVRSNIDSLLTGPLSAENESLALSINADGTLKILEKASGVEFKSLLGFEDGGEIGDGWFHSSPIDNALFNSSGCPADIAIVESGPLRTTFKIVKRMRLPEEMDFASLHRSERLKDFEIAVFASLEKGAKAVKCRVLVDNCVKDHRLKALFETQVKGSKYFAAQPFAYVERERGIDKGTADWKEVDVEERSFCGVAGVSDGRRGLALIAGHGLHEIAARDDKQGTLALTLFRSFKKTVGTPGQTRGQIQGSLEFDFALAPFAGKPDFLELERMSQDFSSGVEAHSGKGLSIEARKPFLSLAKGDALLSTLKPSEDGEALVLRLYNPGGSKTGDSIRFDRPFKSLCECSLDEAPLGKPLAKAASEFKVELPPFKIRSYRISFS